MITQYALLATILLRFDLLVNPGAIPSINGSVFGQQLLPVPPLAEQASIVRWVHTAIRRSDTIAERPRTQIERLREYRLSLLSACVSGEFDVASAKQMNQANELLETSGA